MSDVPALGELARCECGKTKAQHIDVLGRLFCHEFTATTSGPDAVAEYTPWSVTTARSALECYGRHHSWCAYWTPIADGGIAKPCSCGYDDAVLQLVALASGGAAGGLQQESDTAQDERELLARANRSRGAKDGWEIRRRRERGDL